MLSVFASATACGSSLASADAALTADFFFLTVLTVAFFSVFFSVFFHRIPPFHNNHIIFPFSVMKKHYRGILRHEMLKSG